MNDQGQAGAAAPDVVSSYCRKSQHGWCKAKSNPFCHCQCHGSGRERAYSTPKPAGVVDGVLYCYGGCGRRYVDFPLDVSLPTSLWNQIAVGAPFDETQQGIEREGRGGVLCASCIVERLKSLLGVTVAFLTTDTVADALSAALAREAALRAENERPRNEINALPRYHEQDVAQRPSMTEYFDAESVLDALDHGKEPTR